jgi:hypothetical protein
MRSICLLIGLVLKFHFGLGTIAAQEPNMDKLCSEVDRTVVVRQNPLRVLRERAIDACTFSLNLADNQMVEFRIERFNTANNAKVELESIEHLRTRQTSRQSSNIGQENRPGPKHLWDQFVQINYADSTSFVLLRKGKFFILVVGKDRFVKETEYLLRDIRFY